MNTPHRLLLPLLLGLSLLCSLNVQSEDTTYALERATSVAAGRRYVMEQDGYVMTGSIVNSALQTTSTYASSGLTGTEPYVWTLEEGAGGYLLRNCSLAANAYLKNTSSTSLSLTASHNQPTVWTFSFDELGVAFVASTGGRYLGYSNPTSHAYKAYAASGYACSIVVYELRKEGEDEGEAARHTVRFSINGSVDEALSQEMEEGQSIRFPSSPKVEGWTFVGWTLEPITQSQAEEPDMVNTAEERMGTDDVTYYAVFALTHSDGAGRAELTGEDIMQHFTSEHGQEYADDERSWQNGPVTWTIKGRTTLGRDFLQIRQNALPSYVHIVAPSPILQVDVVVGAASTSSEYKGSLYAVTEPTASSSANAVGSCDRFSQGRGSIALTEPCSDIYLQASTAVRIYYIGVTYSEGLRYDHYCTTTSDPGTGIGSLTSSRLPLPHYNLHGHRVNPKARGLYIASGSKWLK